MCVNYVFGFGGCVNSVLSFLDRSGNNRNMNESGGCGFCFSPMFLGLCVVLLCAHIGTSW
jgi:hypothetical protein